MTTSSEGSSPLLALSHALANAVERTGRFVVAVNARTRIAASGVHWRDGVVVTAEHALKRDEEIAVALPDGSTQGATLVGRDPSTDLAVLRIAPGLATPELGGTEHLKIGNVVLAVARSAEIGIGASFGVISSLAGPWRTWRGGQIEQLVRLDLSLYPGFSGSAVVDTEGRLLGIATAGLSRTGGIALPATTVDRVVDQLLTRGRIARGFLGVGMQPVRLPAALVQSLGLCSEGGVIVVSLEPDGPAAKAGMLIGDILVALDSQPVADTEEVLAFLGPERVGNAVKASLVRGGARSELVVTVGERPGRER
jgi:S1-C subfamily serine protease